MYQRNINKTVSAALDDTPVIILVGARQVGKSTLCLQLIQDGTFNAQAVTLDDPTTMAAAQADPLGFLEGMSKHLIIDEVQRVPELLISIKKIVDEDRKNRRVILTGSADVMTLPKIADSLAGRTEIIRLWPLSQEEIEGKTSSFLDCLTTKFTSQRGEKTSWESLMTQLSIGGYPEVLARKTASRRTKWFDAYISSIMQKDIQAIANIEGLTQIPNLLYLISTRVGSTINLSDIARLSGIKNTTLQRYMALLEYVFLIIKIPAWTPNAEGQYVKSPKVIINDSGLLCHLRGETVKSLIKNKSIAGAFFENFAVMEIIKMLSWYEDTLKPYHFSIHKGAEVDLVLEDKKKQIYGIEIKSTYSLKEDDFKGLKHLEKVSKGKFEKGIVIYPGDQFVAGFGGNNLYAIPISSLWSCQPPE